MSKRLFNLTREVSIDPDLVSFISVEHDDCYGRTTLVVGLTDGSRHSVTHNPHFTDGHDVYKIKAELSKVCLDPSS